MLTNILREVKGMSIDEYNRLFDEVKDSDIRIVTENYSVHIVRRTVSYITNPYVQQPQGYEWGKLPLDFDSSGVSFSEAA
jgi:hypothetical protein